MRNMFILSGMDARPIWINGTKRDKHQISIWKVRVVIRKWIRRKFGISKSCFCFFFLSHHLPCPNRNGAFLYLIFFFITFVCQNHKKRFIAVVAAVDQFKLMESVKFSRLNDPNWKWLNYHDYYGPLIEQLVLTM